MDPGFRRGDNRGWIFRRGALCLRSAARAQSNLLCVSASLRLSFLTAVVPNLRVVSSASAAEKVIDIRGLSLVFQTADAPVQALADIDLQVGRGEFVSFIGPSGCGKTTLLRVIADLERQTAGQITVNGVSPEDARKARA